MSSFSWTCRRLLMITVAACSSSLYTDSVNTASQFKSLCQELPRLVSRSRSWRQLSRHSVIVQQWELPSNVHVRYQEYIITRVSNFQYPRRNTVYKVMWLPGYCTWENTVNVSVLCSICMYLEGAWSSANVISNSHATEMDQETILGKQRTCCTRYKGKIA